jgi:hypothetical protein
MLDNLHHQIRAQSPASTVWLLLPGAAVLYWNLLPDLLNWSSMKWSVMS